VDPDDEPEPEPEDDDALTVDTLARAAGTTSRNVRSYQTRGLLPPPKISGRVGFYGRIHLARLKLISSLKTRGYSLAAIADLIVAWGKGQTVGQLLGLERALSARYQDERQVIISRAELDAQFPVLRGEGELLDRFVALDLVQPVGGGPAGDAQRFHVPSPKLLEVGQRLLEAGVPAFASLDELEALREQARATASRLAALFTTYVWEPWIAAGKPMDQVPDLVRKVRQLQPAPPMAASAVMAQALDQEISRVVAGLLSSARRDEE